MVTNMISQLQESFPLRRAAGSFEISFTKWLRGAKTVQLLVTFSMRFDTFYELEEQHSKIKFVSPRGHVISSICSID